MPLSSKQPQEAFHLHQKAAFALVSNWVQNQNGNFFIQTDGKGPNLRRSAHVYDLEIKKRLLSDEVLAVLKKSINHLRNIMSHGHHKSEFSFTQEQADHLNQLVMRASQIYSAHFAESALEAKKSTCSSLSKGEAIFNFRPVPLIDQAQPELAFLLAPFATRSQMMFLLGKIFIDKTRRETYGTAIEELLLYIAQPDNIIMRTRQDGEQTWIASSHEQAFAIWGILGKKIAQSNEAHDSSLPIFEDNYVMRQLISFIENNQILGDCQFLRIKTEQAKEEEQLEQKKCYSADRNLPLAMIYNTIPAQFSNPDIRVTFSLKSLLYIVALYLAGESENHLRNIVSGLARKYQNYSHLEIKAKSHKPLDAQITARIDCLIQKLSTPPRNIQDRIRFICQIVQGAFLQKTGTHLHKGEYAYLEDKVRYFRKEEFRAWLDGQGVLDQQSIHLGQGNEKTLRHLIKAERLERLYDDLVKPRKDWLVGVAEGLHKRTDEEKQELAKILGCRGLASSKPETSKPTPPVGIQLKWLFSPFPILHDEGLLSMLNSYASPYKFPMPKKGGGRGWSHVKDFIYGQILTNMAWHVMKDIVSIKFTPGESNNFIELADLPISYTLGDKEIQMSFGKSWRSFAQKSPQYLEALLKLYGNDANTAPLFRADETKGKKSIETMEIEARDERFLFIMAMLSWEENWLKNQPSQWIVDNQQPEGYIQFQSIIGDENLDSKLRTYRNAAFHNHLKDMPTRFSQCPEPIKSAYKDQKSKQDERRKKQKQRAHKTRQKTAWKR